MARMFSHTPTYVEVLRNFEYTFLPLHLIQLTFLILPYFLKDFDENVAVANDFLDFHELLDFLIFLVFDCCEFLTVVIYE